MSGQNPLETVDQLVEAINRGDLEAAVALYEPHATMVVEPGKVAKGKEEIRTALEGFISLKPALKGEAHQIVEGGNLALFCSRWSLIGTGTDGNLSK